MGVGERLEAPPAADAGNQNEVAMTFFELGILLTSAGVSAAGCAALFGVVLDRIGREPAPHGVPIVQPQRQVQH
jgi:hypothetical protein